MASALLSTDDGFPTQSSRQQHDTERSVLETIQKNMKNPTIVDLDSSSPGASELPVLHREKHISFLLEGLEQLSGSYACLDASRPWLCYWILHSLAILDADVPPALLSRAAKFLGKCQASSGGFCGGPGQLPHLAPTFAAVNALATIATPEAIAIIDRPALLSFLLSMKDPSGGFTMHLGGEVDVRGSYCALNAAFIAGVLTPELQQGCADYIVQCQTYEGGMGGEPGNEAHGGYTFCAYAALVLLQQQTKADRGKLLRWAIGKQMAIEGGFQGRANKLVDGCYSFWQGGLIPLLSRQLALTTVVPIPPEAGEDERGAEAGYDGAALTDHMALQKYILAACQENGGGLRDKPEKRRDYYHTCYCLSGLSVAQHPDPRGEPQILGPQSNKVQAVDAVLNVVRHKASRAMELARALPPLSTTAGQA